MSAMSPSRGVPASTGRQPLACAAARMASDWSASDATATTVKVQITKSRKVSWNLTGEQLRSLGAGPRLTGLLLAWDERSALLTVALAAFGRAIAEVGMKPEKILLTHGHGDHVGDTVSLFEHFAPRVIALADEVGNPLAASNAEAASGDGGLPALVGSLAPALRDPVEGLMQARDHDQRALLIADRNGMDAIAFCAREVPLAIQKAVDAKLPDTVNLLSLAVPPALLGPLWPQARAQAASTESASPPSPELCSSCCSSTRRATRRCMGTSRACWFCAGTRSGRGR